MTPATLAPPLFDLGPVPVADADPGASAAPEHGGQGRLTLDELLVGVWEGLRNDHAAACPVCGGAMLASPAAGPRSLAGHCRDCASVLS